MQYNDLPAGTIYQTKDYDRFKYLDEGNREVDIKHVKKYKKSIEAAGDHGKVFPIVVDQDFNIIDGQHRFTGRKELGLIIYYVQDIALDSKVLGIINDAMKKWTRNDFIDVSSNEDIVQELEDIKRQIGWEQLTYSTLLTTLGVNLKGVLSTNAKTKDRQVANLLRKKTLFIYYMKDLIVKITDKDRIITTSSISKDRALCMLALKLARYGVSLDDIPTGTYDSILASLYSKGLIQ